MIENHLGQSGMGYLLLAPNRSLSWHGNKWLLAAVGMALAVPALGFAALGLWLLLPFAGLEFALLAAGLYATNRQGHYREIIAFTETEVLFQRGWRHPIEETRFPRHWAHFVVRSGPHRSSPRHILLRCHGREVEIAARLSDEDKERLLDHLHAVVRRRPAGHAAA